MVIFAPLFIYFFFFSLFLPRCAFLIFFYFFFSLSQLPGWWTIVSRASRNSSSEDYRSPSSSTRLPAFFRRDKTRNTTKRFSNVVFPVPFLLALWTRSASFSKFTPQSGISRHFVSFLSFLFFFFLFLLVKDDRRTIVRESERKQRIHEAMRETIPMTHSCQWIFKLGERNCKFLASSIPPHELVHSSINLFVQLSLTVPNSDRIRVVFIAVVSYIDLGYCEKWRWMTVILRNLMRMLTFRGDYKLRIYRTSYDEFALTTLRIKF